MTRALTLPLIALAILATTANARAQDVAIVVHPDSIWIETTEAGQRVNFDFELENRRDEKLLINKIEVSVLDEAGDLVRRDFVDEYGRASLELQITPSLEAGGSALIFNPLHTFPAGLPLTTLRYAFSFSSDDRTRYFTSAIDVHPVPYEAKTDLILPVRGRVLVWDGNDPASHHRRFDYTQPFFVEQGHKTNFQRYSYDFVHVDEEGRNYSGEPRVNDDWYRARPDDMEAYYSFGEPIYAAGAGQVAFVVDARADDRRVDPAWLETDERAYAGNYVVIDHQNGEFSWYGHIKQGSARVEVGQMVKQGEVVAEIGAAGSSLFPHLHFELRNGPGAKVVEGLPSTFTNFRRIVGSRTVDVEKGTVDTGDIVDWRP